MEEKKDQEEKRIGMFIIETANQAMREAALMPDPEALYSGDWDKPEPIREIAGDQILLEMGKVAVAFDGNMWLNGYYNISADRLQEDGWILHLTETKKWFDKDTLEDFKRCYLIACKLAGKKRAHQIKDYKERKNK